MSQQKLINKKIVISAAADGIGWSIAQECILNGAIVYITDNNNESLDRVSKHELFEKKLFIEKVNTSNFEEVEKYFNRIKKNLESIDALINNVGIAGPTGKLENLNIKDWKDTIDININSHFYYTKFAIPLLKNSNSGSIINISSTAGIFGFPLRTPYAASKWAVIGMTKTLAMELGKYKIRVNAICPGTIKGDRMKRVIRDKAKFTKISAKKIENEFVSMASMNCWIYEDDIGKMCAFLISDEAERISGQIIGVDGNAIRLD